MIRLRTGDLALLALGVLLAGCEPGDGNQAAEPSLQPTTSDYLGTGAPKAELLLLGVFHFADQGLDAYKPRFQLDINSPERLREIEDLVERLARFRPTKVAVEQLSSRQATLDSLYLAYEAGRYQLETNEVYQLGFRLAKRLALPRVYAVDAVARSYMTDDEARARVVALGLNMDTVMRQIESDPWTARYQRLYAQDDSLKTVRTLMEHLLYMNDPERIRVGHGAYLVGGFKLGPEAEYLGVDDATRWYNRNLRIFSNLQHMTTDSGERILLVIGAGHLPILRFLAQASPEFRLREPAEFITHP